MFANLLATYNLKELVLACWKFLLLKLYCDQTKFKVL